MTACLYQAPDHYSSLLMAACELCTAKTQWEGKDVGRNATIRWANIKSCCFPHYSFLQNGWNSSHFHTEKCLPSRNWDKHHAQEHEWNVQKFTGTQRCRRMARGWHQIKLCSQEVTLKVSPRLTPVRSAQGEMLVFNWSNPRAPARCAQTQPLSSSCSRLKASWLSNPYWGNCKGSA